MKQVLPDRLSHFVSLYEKPKNRKSVSYGNYVVQDYMQNLTVTLGAQTLAEPRAVVPQFDQQLAILKATSTRFSSSLYEIKQLVQADLFDDEIEASKELLKSKFYRAAGIVAGVVLEKHLRQVCSDHNIKLNKKNPTLNDLNEALKKAEVIDLSVWRRISLLADLRNLCAHHNEKEPKSDQINDLIEGTIRAIKSVT